MLSLVLIIIVGCVCGATSQSCHQGWTYYQKSCYYFSDITLDWINAGAFCQVHHSELVAIETQAENAFIESEVKNRTGGYWLGGNDSVTEGVWEWTSTDEVFDYTNFGPGEPNDSNGGEDCLMTVSALNGKWNDGICSTSLLFICERMKEGPVIG
ncbi:C-type lectin superfamily 17 member A [Mytilus galloprovincialis]|uniref:C-type lectin superfamily 17 member A n=1 Tax=Mytilus galloprovincialis TaxID=29158 RepID=A0A8B6BKH8_MYTGA|nr:C-type lectin superfamily 17 member A [Mytilus galloprovincialis]